MKKLSILFVSILTLGLSVVSCNSDDDDNGGSIEGKWELSKAGAIINGQEFLETIDNEGGCPNNTIEFLQGGTFTETESEFFNEKCESETYSGTWTISGNKLTMRYGGESDGDSSDYEVKGNTLKLKQTYSEGDLSMTAVAVFIRK